MVGEVYIDFRLGTITGNFRPGPDARAALIAALDRVVSELKELPDNTDYLDYDEGKVFAG